MKSRISASTAARSLSEILNRVRYKGESFVVERGGKAICEISPVAPVNFNGIDLAELLLSVPAPDKEYLDLVEALNANQSTVEKSPWRR
jgi:antitoxin (DNA-binding transcriptional repressor) of toxin-antitoxin stability system